jgi:hypothetical protein
MIAPEMLSTSDSHLASRHYLEVAWQLDRIGGAHTSICLRMVGQWFLVPPAGAPVPEIAMPPVTTTSGTTLPAATRARLLELSQLEPDWDSYGALAVSHHALAATGTLVSRIVARAGVKGVPQEIMPIADGGVALEWRCPSVELGLNACPEGGWSYLVVKCDEKGRHFTEGYDLSDDGALELVFRTVGSLFA